jgi:type VI secretion system protein ImpK
MSNAQSNSPAAGFRRENLAMHFQEPITAIVRLRAGRQPVSDPQWFRRQLRDALQMATEQSRNSGYNSDDVKSAAFAIVAFLDESILNSNNPVFADWSRKTLQEELFGTHLAGEIFFDNLDRLLSRPDSNELADLLEVYQLAILLGFSGRYSLGNQGELHAVLSRISGRIDRIRGPLPKLSPHGLLGQERAPQRIDRWANRLAIAALVSAILLIICFAGFKIALSSQAEALQPAAGQGS